MCVMNKNRNRKLRRWLLSATLLLGVSGGLLGTHVKAATTFDSPLSQVGSVSLPTLGKATPQPLDTPVTAPDVPTKKEDGKTVLQVETKVTDDDAESLKQKTYKPEDSLLKPLIVSSTMDELKAKEEGDSKDTTKLLSMGLGKWFETKVKADDAETKNTNPSSDITIPAASISVQDGTSTFDSDSQPGYDSSATNGIVRSWDSVTYLVSFSIQNTNLDDHYTDIRYRVISNLANAITMNGTVPQVNAGIVNGTYYNQDGTPWTSGNGYSEGIMESTISNTGQVFVPVSVGVQGAPNGLSLQPTFKVEIVDAVNQDTGETVTFNNTYDTNDYSSLTPSAVKVSAKPSVNVQLTKGQRFNGSNASTVLGGDGSNKANLQAWNVGATIVLNSLPADSSHAARPTGDYRGSTFPTGPVSFTLGLSGTYGINGGNQSNALSNSQGFEMTVQRVAPALGGSGRPNTTWTTATGGYITGFSPSPLNGILTVPYAKTGQIYSNQPTGDTSKIGVYDSGAFSATNVGGTDLSATSTVTNNNYVGVYNPYTYNMDGSLYSKSNKPFSSSELVIRWDMSKTASLAQTNNWSRTDITLAVKSVSYNGMTVSGNSTLTYSDLYSPSGTYNGMNSMVSGNSEGGSYFKVNENSIYDFVGTKLVPLSVSGDSLDYNFGDVNLKIGQSIYVGARQESKGNAKDYGTKQISMWDPSALKYDNSRPVGTRFLKDAPNISSTTFKYGVAKNLKQTAPYTMKILPESTTETLYNWYSTPEEASANGDISAVQYTILTVGTVDSSRTSELVGAGTGFISDFYVPLKVISSTPGSVTPAGNPLTVLRTGNWLAKDTVSVSFDPISSAPGSSTVTGGNYKPTTFNSDGTVQSLNGQQYWNFLGESAFIKNFGVITQTAVDKPVYDVNDPINITLKAITNGSTTDDYWGTLKTTLPPGITYTAGTAKDGQGNALPEPTITTTGSGTSLQQILTWTYGMNGTGEQINNVDVTKGLEVHIGATSILGTIFKNPGFDTVGKTKSSLTINTIATMQNGSSSDTSADAVRSSSASFNEQLIQQLILSKTADKAAIDAGNVDAANNKASTSNDITYTVTASNDSVQVVNGLALLDVLPYNGDSRGSKFHGGYTVVKASASLTNSDGTPGTAPTLSFSTATPSSSGINEKTDAGKSINGTVVTSSTDYSKATMFQVTNPTPVDVGATVTLTVTIRPNNDQQAGDLYVNTAGMDSSIVQPVFSQPVRTKVYGRDLSGLAWVDKNKDGLYQKGEQLVSSVPVKLYRTSTVNKDFSNQLVTTDMDGKSFIDASGASTVLTKADGTYSFGNLPEGTYVAEFDIDGLIHKQNFMVTAMNVGDDVSINSKADQKTFRTDSYVTSVPDISTLPSVAGTDSMSHIQYVNLGVTAPPDTVLPNTGGNRVMQIGLMIASGLALTGLLVFVGKYQWLEMKKK